MTNPWFWISLYFRWMDAWVNVWQPKVTYSVEWDGKEAVKEAERLLGLHS